ncbi:hypothetical protein Tco_0403502 [Tanacetum coccineum]
MTRKKRYLRKDDFRVELGVRVLEEEVVPKVDDVSLVDGVFDGAFGGDGEDDVVIGEAHQAAMKVKAEIDVGIGIEVGVRVDREDEDEEEAKSSNRGTIELEDGVQGMYEHIIEIPLQRLEDIKSGQRELEERSLISNEERASMLDRIGYFERDNMKLHGMLCVERQRIDSLSHHVSNTQEELR